MIETVLGPLPAAELGVTSMHDHLLVGEPRRLLDRVERTPE